MRETHFSVAAGEEWDTARKATSRCLRERLRRSVKVCWAKAQPTQRRKTTIVLRFPPEGPSCGDKMRSGSVGARSPILGGLETGTGGGGGESQGWTVSGREETENQDLLSVLLGSGGDFLSLFGCLDGCGDDEVSLLKALEICEKVSDGKPIFLSAAFCARPENILLGVSLQCCECPNSDCRLAKTESS